MSVSVVNWDEFAENFDNDRTVMTLVVESFLESAAEALEKMKEAIEAKDAIAIGMAAHSLKGAMLNFGAAEAVRLAQSLENHAHGQTLPDIDSVYGSLKLAYERLVSELKTETLRYQVAV